MTLIEAAALLGLKRERVIAEKDGDGWLVMWPDGSIERFRAKRDVLRAIRGRLGEAYAMVTELEWRP